MSVTLDRNEIFGVKSGIVVETKEGPRPDRGNTAKVITKDGPPAEGVKTGAAAK